MKDSDGIDFITKIFERVECLSDGLGDIELAVVNGGKHFLGEIWANTNTAGCEAVNLKASKMGNRGLLTYPADNKSRNDKLYNS